MATWASLFEHYGTDPAVDRLDVDRGGQRTLVVGVPTAAAAPEVAAGLVRDEGVTLIELCGGFSTADVARVAEAVGPSIAVGHVAFSVESVSAAARYGSPT